MMKCQRCSGRVLVDRQYTSIQHIETYCISCGSRKFFHPPSESLEGKWLLATEIARAKYTIATI
jgi:hypothetical protein